MILRLCSLIVFLCLSTQLTAVDLFGNEQLKPGELPMSEQEELYQQFFGEFDSKANNSGKRLDLAASLQKQCADAKYAPLQRYMLKRIAELCEGQNKYEAYTALIFVFQQKHLDKEPNYQSNSELLSLLESQMSKAPKDEREAILSEITALCNFNAKLSLQQKNYERASDDYKMLASWLGKTKDKDGANLAKDMIKNIKDYVDARDDIAEIQIKADADPTDVKSHAEVGRFLFSDKDWKKSLPYLSNGQELILAEIAAIAQNESPDYDQQGQCAVAIGKALSLKENRNDTPIKRALLQLGIYYKKILDAKPESLSPAMKIKYTLVSESWASELEAIGPNPLVGFEVAEAGASVDEARLIRMGWVAIFDHEHICIARPEFTNSDSLSANIVNGTLVIKQNGQNRPMLDNFPNVGDYKSFKFRFKFVGQNSSCWFTFNASGTWNGDMARVVIREGQAGFSAHYGREAGVLPVLTNEWNDLTFNIDGKNATATLNGQEYPSSIPLPYKLLKRVEINPTGGNGLIELHIQSILGLPHDK